MSATRTAFDMPPVFISLMLMMSAARIVSSSTASRGPKELSSAMTGVVTWSVTYFSPAMSSPRTGCSTSSSCTPLSSSARSTDTACFGVQPWLASRRIRARSPTAAWIALMRSMSSAGSLPTLTLSVSKPDSTAACASSTILSM